MCIYTNNQPRVTPKEPLATICGTLLKHSWQERPAPNTNTATAWILNRLSQASSHSASRWHAPCLLSVEILSIVPAAAPCHCLVTPCAYSKNHVGLLVSKLVLYVSTCHRVHSVCTEDVYTTTHPYIDVYRYTHTYMCIEIQSDTHAHGFFTHMSRHVYKVGINVYIYIYTHTLRVYIYIFV